MIKCDNFGIKELVSPAVYNYYAPRYGEGFIWGFFSENVLQDLDFIRKEWGDSIIINDWAFGGQYKESGLRCNIDSLVSSKNVPYLSGHCLGVAFDLKPKNKKYKEFHAFLWKLLNSGKLKAFKRLEDIKNAPTWGHIDALRTENGKPIIFSA
jgi:hypothetical protein